MWRWRKRTPITGAGWSATAAAVILITVGSVLRFRELLAPGLACLAALLLASAIVMSAARIESWQAAQLRVEEGLAEDVALTVRNPNRHNVRPTAAFVRVGELELPVRLPPLPPQRRLSVRYQLPARDRGVYRVSGLVAEYADPLRLVALRFSGGQPSDLFVRPRMHHMAPLPLGRAEWSERHGRKLRLRTRRQLPWPQGLPGWRRSEADPLAVHPAQQIDYRPGERPAAGRAPARRP